MSAQPNTPSITRTVPAGQLNLHVTEFGTDKPPLVLLHGIGSDVSSWWPVIDGLAAHYRLIVPDQRGHGRSAKPDHGYLIPDYVADLEGLINAYGIERPAIMGHSLGGLVTLGWASRNPTRAGKIVIEDAPLRTAPDVDGLFDGWIALASSTPAEAAAVYARDYPTWSAEDCWRRAEMITSTRPSVSFQISGPVVLKWISGFAGFLNCCGRKYSGFSAAIFSQWLSSWVPKPMCCASPLFSAPTCKDCP